MNKVAVVGAGAWGTALAIQAARAGCAVVLVPREPARAAQLAAERSNPRLPGVRLPDSVLAAPAVPASADAILLAPPIQHLREAAAALPPGEAPLIVCAKGIETGTHLLPLEIVAEAAPQRPAAYLTGPNFAAEIAAGLPAATVLAATDPALRGRLIALLATPAFRLYGNADPVGSQVGGAAKNVVAIAAGAVIGGGLGENARAALITRGLAELRRVALALGGKAETVMGLSGLGDLLLTCTGTASRNFSLGLGLGRGEKLAALLARARGVVEGVASAPALLARAGGTDLPIIRAVAAVLAGEATVARAMGELLSRPLRDE